MDFPRELQFGIEWFRDKADQALAKKLNHGCVYLIGTDEASPIRLGWGSDPFSRLNEIQPGNWLALKIHDIVWCPGASLAQRVGMRFMAMLAFTAGRMRGQWLDMSVADASSNLRRSAELTGVPVMDHAAYLDHVVGIRQSMIERDIAALL